MKAATPSISASDVVKKYLAKANAKKNPVHEEVKVKKLATVKEVSQTPSALPAIEVTTVKEEDMAPAKSKPAVVAQSTSSASESKKEDTKSVI